MTDNIAEGVHSQLLDKGIGDLPLPLHQNSQTTTLIEKLSSRDKQNTSIVVECARNGDEESELLDDKRRPPEVLPHRELRLLESCSNKSKTSRNISNCEQSMHSKVENWLQENEKTFSGSATQETNCNETPTATHSAPSPCSLPNARSPRKHSTHTFSEADDLQANITKRCVKDPALSSSISHVQPNVKSSCNYSNRADSSGKTAFVSSGPSGKSGTRSQKPHLAFSRRQTQKRRLAKSYQVASTAHHDSSITSLVMPSACRSKQPTIKSKLLEKHQTKLEPHSRSRLFIPMIVFLGVLPGIVFLSIPFLLLLPAVLIGSLPAIALVPLLLILKRLPQRLRDGISLNISEGIPIAVDNSIGSLYDSKSPEQRQNLRRATPNKILRKGSGSSKEHITEHLSRRQHVSKYFLTSAEEDQLLFRENEYESSNSWLMNGTESSYRRPILSGDASTAASIALRDPKEPERTNISGGVRSPSDQSVDEGHYDQKFKNIASFMNDHININLSDFDIDINPLVAIVGIWSVPLFSLLCVPFFFFLPFLLLLLLPILVIIPIVLVLLLPLLVGLASCCSLFLAFFLPWRSIRDQLKNIFRSWLDVADSTLRLVFRY